MLVLTRKSGESVIVGQNITIKVAQVSGNRVKLCIDAPQDCQIQRAELLNAPLLRREVAAGTPSLHGCGVPQ